MTIRGVDKPTCSGNNIQSAAKNILLNCYFVLCCNFVFHEVTVYACLIVASTASVKIATLTRSDYRKPCFSVTPLSFLMGFTPL